MSDEASYWLTIKEAAVRMMVDPSLIRHQLLKDQQRAVEACWFPSARHPRRARKSIPYVPVGCRPGLC